MPVVDDQRELDIDLLIVGAGPVGLYGAYYAGFRDLSVAVIDGLPEVGGQISTMYPEKMIYDVAGFPGIRGRDLVANLQQQADLFKPSYILGEEAVTLEHDGGSLRVLTSAGRSIRARAMIVAGGIGTFTPRTLPTGMEFLGRGLSHFVREFDSLAGQDVVIVGGGDSAFDWALALQPVARRITLVHRRKAFRAHPSTVRAVTEAGVEILTDCEVVAIRGDVERGPLAIDGVDVKHVPTQVVRSLDAQSVVAALGFTANLGPLLTWGFDLSGRHITVDSTMATNLPRVFAAGDVNDYRGKVRLISVGFGEIATAVNHAAALIDPEQPIFPGHSTDN
ncbi:NAD(P)/FAD-dependent oxidoreductase [Nocardioides sp. LHG3406-4]|uniref:NAD(P)/FAD-dependent oxidoreductase n=1 Tax=Nocardioides sp. LHG3406-4 TaxID=2804575 RepID=UPI003CFAC0F8